MFPVELLRTSFYNLFLACRVINEFGSTAQNGPAVAVLSRIHHFESIIKLLSVTVEIFEDYFVVIFSY